MADRRGCDSVQASSLASFDLACPRCRAALSRAGPVADCDLCARSYVLEDRVWRFLPPERQKVHEAFLCRYRTVRSSEGWGAPDPDYYRNLPFVPRDDPQIKIWKIRANSFRALTRILAGTPALKVLDAGAGNCWLSNRMTLLGSTVAPVDISDDRYDGLGACVNYTIPLECYQAEFDGLPFQGGQFDLVVFNGSLHYTRALAATLSEAVRVLRPQGRIIVMDSPFFSDAASGMAMRKEWDKKHAWVSGGSHPGTSAGFLTEIAVQSACGEAGLCMRLLCADASWHQKLRRRLVQMRIGREPARFPILMIERQQTHA